MNNNDNTDVSVYGAVIVHDHNVAVARVHPIIGFIWWILVHGQVTIIFVVSVCLFVCTEFFSAVFDPISIKLGHMLYVWV